MLDFVLPQVNQTIGVLAVNQAGVTMNYGELALKGGWIMIPILALSLIAVFIFVDRFLAIRKASKVDPNLMNQIRQNVSEGKIDAALAICRSANHPITRMLEKGIVRIGRPLDDVNKAIENVGNLEVAQLEKGLPWLATTAGGAPMLGFLGTVTGMVRAFFDMASAGNNIDIQLLSSGIYEAMVTTVAGLIVGVMAYFGYNFLVSRIENLIFKMEMNTTEFMDMLNEPA
ncbi:MAG TPA: MotA/TolQ/ExbB proton channel family protein [Prolixibacteraceae bacterium]|nr:MotA/TolQ/ExbB proton channel family protein [Bacteroidales bacterium]HUM88842.1 MotA/TolQ/ExbB proton channel family protein [Prolixibacteraceae bacterium]